VQALSDFWKQVSDWRKRGRIPEDFSGRKRGYQSFVELLREIDSNPTDSDRLDALKAMFLAVNRPDESEGSQILAYQLFQTAKKLSSGDLLVTQRAQSCEAEQDTRLHRTGLRRSLTSWYGATALIEQHERVLVQNGLSPALRVNAVRLTDFGSAFCRNLQTFR
jgi:hypothetical protein